MIKGFKVEKLLKRITIELCLHITKETFVLLDKNLNNSLY